MAELRVTVTDEANGAVVFVGRLSGDHDEYLSIDRSGGPAVLEARVRDLSASLGQKEQQ